MQRLNLRSMYALLLLLLCLLNPASAHEWVGASLKHDYSRYFPQNEGAIMVIDY